MLTAQDRGAWCAAPCVRPAAPSAKAQPVRVAPKPQPAPVVSTVAAAPAVDPLAQLRELVGRLERACERLERAKAPRAERAAPTVAEALAPVSRAEDEVAVLGELVGAWRTAPDLARSSGLSADRVRRLLAGWLATSEAQPDPLVERRTVAGVAHWRATSAGENTAGDAVSFGPEVVDAVVAAMVAEQEAA